jgi:hypothetical protein
MTGPTQVLTEAVVGASAVDPVEPATPAELLQYIEI